MGTLIKSISFQNFYNYYGDFEDNTYTFTEGINIINADNNLGKSKFYNGFLWILHDQVYDSDDRKMCEAKESFRKMISVKARNENSQKGMGVRIVFENDEVTYTITKRVVFTGSELTPHYSCEVIKTKDNEDLPIVDKEDQLNAIRKMIPIEMEQYALLQGESMESIVDLSTFKGLENTINILADINNLNQMCDKANQMVKKAAIEKKAIEDKHTIAGSELFKLQNDRTNYQDWIEQAETKIKTARAEIAEATRIAEDIDNEFMNTKKRIQLRSEYEKEETELERLKKNKEEMELSYTSRIFDENRPWLLWGLESEITQFDDLRVDFIGRKKEKSILANPDILLPEGSPDVPSLQRMLQNEICEVCGRPAHKGSEEYKHIKMVLERPRKSVPQTNGSLNQFYSDIQNTIGGYLQTIPSIKEEYEQFLDEFEDLDEQIKRQEQRVQDKLNELALVDSGDSTDQEDRMTLSKYTQAKNVIRDKTNDIATYSSRIDIWKQSLEKTIRELNKKQDNTEVQKAEAFYQEMINIATLFTNVRNRVYDTIVNQLQDKANEMYRALTAHNQTFGGTMQFQKRDNGSLKVMVTNDAGEELTGNGTGFQRMKQLALVMSIISSKITDKRFDYPFISDAPFSEFSINFIDNFFQTSPTVFRQCIIMIKDLCDPTDPNLITQYGMSIAERMRQGELKGTFYVNYTEERTDNSQMITHKKCYSNN